jgi:hypothetical protein
MAPTLVDEPPETGDVDVVSVVVLVLVPVPVVAVVGPGAEDSGPLSLRATFGSKLFPTCGMDGNLRKQRRSEDV